MKIISYNIDELADEVIRRRSQGALTDDSLRTRWRDHRFFTALGRVRDEQLSAALARASSRRPRR